MAQNLKTGDTVKIIAGDEKGQTGKIVSVDKKTGKACIEGIRLIERHVKATYYNPKGSKKTIHAGIDLSNLKLEKSAETPKKAKNAKKGDK